MYNKRETIYSHKKLVRVAIRTRFINTLNETREIVGSTPLDKYRVEATEYYSVRLNEFYNCVNFCLECNLLTLKEIEKLKRELIKARRFEERQIKPYSKK